MFGKCLGLFRFLPDLPVSFTDTLSAPFSAVSSAVIKPTMHNQKMIGNQPDDDLERSLTLILLY